MKQPIAMRCTKKQFKAIKPKLKEIGTIGRLNGAFKEYKYLNNNYGPKENNFDFVNNTSLWQREHQNNIHEEWNEKIFLEACGIEAEKTFSITESQILDTYHFIEYQENADKFRSWFPDAFKVPEAFESEVKLERGMWLTRDTKDNKWIVYVSLKNDIYGINMEGEWFNSSRNDNTIDEMLRNKINREATEQEVFEALKNEAVKRGFVGDQYIDITSLGFVNNELITGGELEWKEGWLNFGDKKTAIFKNGVWGKVIDSITLSEAEQQLKKKIIFNK